MEQSPKKQTNQNVQTQKQHSQAAPQILKAYYSSLGDVKMTFKVLQDFIKQINSLQLVMPPETKLIEVKKKIDQMSNKNFIFYLKDSFMPSLNSRIGDLAQCYARFDQTSKLYEMPFTICATKDYFG